MSAKFLARVSIHSIVPIPSTHKKTQAVLKLLQTFFKSELQAKALAIIALVKTATKLHIAL